MYLFNITELYSHIQLAIPRVTTAPLRPHTARTDRHWAWEKQPAKPDHSSLADFDCIVYSCSFVFWVKNRISDMGDKTGFPRLGHIQYYT